MSNKFVIADPAVCIGCKTCMAACLAKHDVPGDVPMPRLNVVFTKTVSAPIVCRQCADAPCAAACPVGALYQDDATRRVAVREGRCIGCRRCVAACPYGAADVASRPVSRAFGNMTLSEGSSPFVVKCDLCVDRPGGPACVAACPTKGCMVVDEDMLGARAGARVIAKAAPEPAAATA